MKWHIWCGLFIGLFFSAAVVDCGHRQAKQRHQRMVAQRAAEQAEVARREAVMRRIKALQAQRQRRRQQAVDRMEARHGVMLNPDSLLTADDRWLATTVFRLRVGDLDLAAVTARLTQIETGWVP